MVDMLDAKMYSLNEAILELSQKQDEPETDEVLAVHEEQNGEDEPKGKPE